MTDMEILGLADKCGVTAVSKHEWDGKRFNHTDDSLDGDFAGLIQFARLLIADERETCAKVVEADGLARGEHGYMLIKAATRIRARGET
jgi:hypothetical protein